MLAFMLVEPGVVSGEEHRYRIATVPMVSGTAIRMLYPWRAWGMTQRWSAACERPAFSTPALIHDGPAWLGNATRWVRCWSEGGNFRIEIAGFDELLLLDNGRKLVYEGEPEVDSELLEEVVLGPGMILALACHGVFSLHASAICFHKSACAFVGESGLGKSTLVRYLQEHVGPDCQRIGDDILPLESGPTRPNALPHFPQLKLSMEEQVPHDFPERVPLAAVYVLDTRSGQNAEGVRISNLPPHASTAALVRHSVASRLFTPTLLEQHLTFCAKAARQIPVRMLSYPRRFDVLPAVCEALAVDLETVAGE
jgi:hypothetical protein